MTLKQALRSLTPAPVRAGVHRYRIRKPLQRAYGYDLERYYRFSTSVDISTSRQNLGSKLTASYHNLEKGLSLPDPRPGFGAAVVARVVRLSTTYLEKFGEDHVVRAAVSALLAYVDFNRAAGLADADIPSHAGITTLAARLTEPVLPGGTKTMTREDVLTAVAGVDARFFDARSSVRQFEPGPVDLADVEFAVRAAQKSPAVCNRQYSSVHLLTDPADVARALEIQGGARGFASNVPAVAVITTNIRNFWGPGERMQPWTDGGMFAMSFVLGLHSRGLGSVCLNWSKTEELDRRFRDAFDIPAEEVIVMLVALGRLRETFTVACSPRRSVAESLHVR